MGRNKCAYMQTLETLLREGKREFIDYEHTGRCAECSDLLFVRQAMDSVSTPPASKGKYAVPEFDLLWNRAFDEPAVSRETIRKALMPLQVAVVFSWVVGIAAIIIFGLIIGRGSDVREGIMNVIGPGFITPLIRIFNSSYFVSIPMSVVCVSIMVYFLSFLLRSFSHKTAGSG